MLGRSIRMVAVVVATSAAALTIGTGAAHAKPGTPIKPVNPCAFNPQACQGPTPPIIHVDPCVIDPNSCPPPTTTPPAPKPNPGSGSHGSSGQGSGSGGSNGALNGSSLAGKATVHAVRHPSGGDSGSDPLVIGAGAALVASLAGLGGFAVWRRRSLA